MFQIRVHGRGGQGVVTTAELLSVAAFVEGHHAQAFPSFGSERTGAPVVAFCRLSDRPIRTREPIARPDAVIVQDPTLLRSVAVCDGLRRDGYLLVNSSRGPDSIGLGGRDGTMLPGHVITVPATRIALEELLRPMPGAPLIGAFAALTGRIGLDAVLTALAHRFDGRIRDANIEAARRGHEAAAALVRERAHA